MHCLKWAGSTGGICKRRQAKKTRATPAQFAPRVRVIQAAGHGWPCQMRVQPPFLGRLPGFFLLRVAVPRSRLTFWPWPELALWPLGGTGLGAQMSASTLIFLDMKDSG